MKLAENTDMVVDIHKLSVTEAHLRNTIATNSHIYIVLPRFDAG